MFSEERRGWGCGHRNKEGKTEAMTRVRVSQAMEEQEPSEPGRSKGLSPQAFKEHVAWLTPQSGLQNYESSQVLLF